MLYILFWVTPRKPEVVECHSVCIGLITQLERWCFRSLWPLIVMGRPLYFAAVVSIFLLSSFFCFPRLISAVADWMSTILQHMMWPKCEFLMHVWDMLHAARWKCRIQKIAKNSPSGHHRTILSGYVFATKAFIDNRKEDFLTSISLPHVLTIWWTSAH